MLRRQSRTVTSQMGSHLSSLGIWIGSIENLKSRAGRSPASLAKTTWKTLVASECRIEASGNVSRDLWSWFFGRITSEWRDAYSIMALSIRWFVCEALQWSTSPSYCSNPDVEKNNSRNLTPFIQSDKSGELHASERLNKSREDITPTSMIGQLILEDIFHIY
jgi:hypothetical protein